MRVLYVEFADGFGGSGKSLLSLIGDLPEDVEPSLLIGYDLSRFADVPPRLKVRLSRAPCRHHEPTSRLWPDLLSLSGYFGYWLRELKRTVAEVRPHIIHANNSLVVNTPAALVGRRRRIPVISHHRGPTWHGKLERAIVRLGLFSRHVAISGWIYEGLVELGIPPQRTRMIYDSISPPEGQRPPAAGEDAPLVIGSFSMLLPWKGIDVLLRAVHRTRSLTPKPFRVVIVGDEPFGPRQYREHLVALAEELGIAPLVTFCGQLKDVYPVMFRTDIAVHSSIDPEPFGRIIPEAMLCGAAVIATEGGGTSESVLHERTGLVVPRGDAEMMAQAIARLIDDAHLRGRLAAAGKDLAQQRFTGRSHVQSIYEMYREVLGESPGRAEPPDASRPEPTSGAENHAASVVRLEGSESGSQTDCALS